MSDQENIVEEELDLEESAELPQKKGPFLSPLIIRILLIVALVIVITLIAIIVFIVGSKLVSPVGITTRLDEWGEEISRPQTMHLESIVLEDPFRQQLLDGKMIQLKINLGYKAQDKKLQQEITTVIPEIRDIIIKQLSRMRSDDFTDASGTSLEKLEDDFLKQINRILNNGKVERIFFQEFTLM